MKEKRQNVKLHTTTDYHDFTWRDCSVEHRRRLHVGDIYVNAARCKVCGWFIRSRNRHDFVTCSCGAVSVDGGSHYCKRTGDPVNCEDIIEMFNNLEKKANV